MRALFLLLLSVMSASPAAYFCATNGSDSNAGTGTNVPFLTMHKAATVMASGDVLWVRGGVYNCQPTPPAGYPNHFDPSHPVNLVVSNYPGEVPLFINDTNGSFSATSFEVFSLYNANAVKIFGMSASNCMRTMTLNAATNCEIAYCELLHRTTNFVFNGLIYCANNSRSNWFHHLLLHDSQSDYQNTPLNDSGSIFTIGNDTIANDLTEFNLIENCTNYWGSHDCIQVQAIHTIVRSNWFHNEPWLWYTNYQQLKGHRCIADEVSFPPQTNTLVGGPISIYEDNWCGYSGEALNNGAAYGGEWLSPYPIIRRNVLVYNQNAGLKFDGSHNPGLHAEGAHIYQNTIAYNGLGQIYDTNFDGTVLQMGKEGAMTLVRQTNAFGMQLVNNIMAYNGSNYGAFLGQSTNAIVFSPNDNQNVTNAHFGKNWTNSSNGDPLFVKLATNVTIQVTNRLMLGGDTDVHSLGSPFDPPNSNFDFHLQTNSPCIDAGQFLTTITSASGSGTSFTVADPYYFYNGWGMVQGDKIQLSGNSTQVVVTAINYANSNITFNTSLSWVNGQGVALAYNGVAPDMGAFESGQNTAAPLILVTPGSLAFGTTGIPFAKTLTLSVTNVGGGTLTGTASVNAPWTITAGASYSLAANAGQNVTVQFAPTATGSFSDSVVFTGGGGASIPVTGSVTNIITTIISGTTTISGTTVIK